MKQPELTALIQRARAGDPQAQEKLIEDIQSRVYFHCRKMMKNESDAQDAAQDVLITVLTRLDRLRDPAVFYSWVNAIVANRCKHLLTQGVREWQIPEDEDGGSMLDDLEDLDQQAVPDAVLDNKETQRLMMELIDALPPEQRMCVLFYYYDEMSVKDIALAMGTSEGTVKSRLNYARKSIKAGVEDLEKRGTKLYGIAPLPLLALLLRMEAAQGGMSAAQSAGLTASVLSAVHTSAAGTAGASGAAAGTAGGAAGAAAGTAGASAGAAGSAAAAAAGTAAKAGMALGTKILAGILAVTVAAGGAVAAFKLLDQDDPPIEEEEEEWETEEDDEDPLEDLEIPEEPEEDEPEGPSPELLEALDGIVYYGDPQKCRMTPEQAAAFAQVIHQELDGLLADMRWQGVQSGTTVRDVFTGAALFDVGDGTPALFIGGGALSEYSPSTVDNANCTRAVYGIWQYLDGQAVPYAPEGEEPGGYWGNIVALRDGDLFIHGGPGSDGSNYHGWVFPLTGGAIPTVPQTSASYEPIDLLTDPYVSRYYVDGAETTEEAFQVWQSRWEPGEVLCGHYVDGGGGSFTGFGDADATAEALERYASESSITAMDRIEGALLDASQLYAPAYAQKVREIMANPSDWSSGAETYRYDLIYVDDDNIPELLVSFPDRADFFPRAELYTFTEQKELVTAEDFLTAGLRGNGIYYYPRENVVQLNAADANSATMTWDESVKFLQLDSSRTLVSIDGVPDVRGTAEPLEGTMTAEEILAVLEP